MVTEIIITMISFHIQLALMRVQFGVEVVQAESFVAVCTTFTSF